MLYEVESRGHYACRAWAAEMREARAEHSKGLARSRETRERKPEKRDTDTERAQKLACYSNPKRARVIADQERRCERHGHARPELESENSKINCGGKGHTARDAAQGARGSTRARTTAAEDKSEREEATLKKAKRQMIRKAGKRRRQRT